MAGGPSSPETVTGVDLLGTTVGKGMGDFFASFLALGFTPHNRKSPEKYGDRHWSLQILITTLSPHDFGEGADSVESGSKAT